MLLLLQPHTISRFPSNTNLKLWSFQNQKHKRLRRRPFWKITQRLSCSWFLRKVVLLSMMSSSKLWEETDIPGTRYSGLLGLWFSSFCFLWLIFKEVYCIIWKHPRFVSWCSEVYWRWFLYRYTFPPWLSSILHWRLPSCRRLRSWMHYFPGYT